MALAKNGKPSVPTKPMRTVLLVMKGTLTFDNKVENPGAEADEKRADEACKDEYDFLKHGGARKTRAASILYLHLLPA